MKLTFRTKVLGVIFAACVVCTASAIVVARYLVHENAEIALLEKSAAILSRIEEAQAYVGEMGTLGELIEQTKAKFPDGNLTKEHKEKLLKSVPIYVLFTMGYSGEKTDGYKFRIFSDAPRRKPARTERSR